MSDDLPNFGTLVRTSDHNVNDKPTVGKGKTMNRAGTQISANDMKSRPSTVNKEDQKEENGVWFWVNKNGFPVNDVTWERMWDHVAKIHPDGYKMVSTVKGNANHPQVPFPSAPVNFSPSMSIPDRLDKIQTYMNTLQYNHTGTQFFEIKKNRPISGLLEVAKDMIRESLPIKCLEAIILGVYLTNGMLGLERFPISFKTQFNGNFHRHVVLGVYHGGRYGALGMSRRDDLMYKPLVYKTLSELILDYERAYRRYWHDVKKVKVGLPVSHDIHSYEFIQWKTLSLSRNRMTQQELIKEVDSHAKEIRSKRKLNWRYHDHDEPMLCFRKGIREFETPPYSKKSRSWSVPQSNSPRKARSFVDIDTHSKMSTSQGTHSSFNQAVRLYQGNGASKESSPAKKKEGTDLAEYQIRI